MNRGNEEKESEREEEDKEDEDEGGWFEIAG